MKQALDLGHLRVATPLGVNLFIDGTCLCAELA